MIAFHVNDWLEKDENEIKTKMMDHKTNKNDNENEILNENKCIFDLILCHFFVLC